ARLGGAGTIAAAAGGIVAAVAVSGIELELLKPRAWVELVEGVAAGAQSLGTVRLPYAGADPWPRAALELLGSGLLTLAALLACWPRDRGRGYPFLALIPLLVLVASPVVSLGGTRPLVLGLAIAALTVCFLWLERLPLRPGIGVAALLALALAGALPLAAVADRGEPWFDYKAFAEGLGPDDPVRFSWEQQYGPIDWPRDGNEVMRVKSEDPLYWKAANLDEFDGRGWRRRTEPLGDPDFRSELREDWWNKPGWVERVEVSVRRMRSRDVFAPGTVMGLEDATRPMRPTGDPGRWEAPSELRRGDSYLAEVYVPEPSAAEVRDAAVSGFRNVRDEQLEVTVPFREGRGPKGARYGGSTTRRLESAVIHFRPFGDGRGPYATFPEIRRSHSDAGRVLERSAYRRTWRLAERLRAGAETPYEYLLRVNTHLQRGFRYSERPAAPDPGRAPLDAFLVDAQEGYCQHFSGAMALLLRMGGVPARVATGFSPGGYSRRREAWIVRDTDAHSWVEVWFEGVGWVTYDPTPSSTPARSQIAALEAPAAPVAAAPGESGDGQGAGDAAGRAGGLRPDLLLDVDPAFTDEEGAGGGGVPWWAWALGGAAGLALAAA
ncbi:MAG: transglutaminaseTgpA domain-containing protein, partial [Solirubrobacteraceae bacterium]